MNQPKQTPLLSDGNREIVSQFIDRIKARSKKIKFYQFLGMALVWVLGMLAMLVFVAVLIAGVQAQAASFGISGTAKLAIGVISLLGGYILFNYREWPPKKKGRRRR